MKESAVRRRLENEDSLWAARNRRGASTEQAVALLKGRKA